MHSQATNSPAQSGANYDLFSVENEVSIALNGIEGAAVKVVFSGSLADLPAEKKYQACRQLVDGLYQAWHAAPIEINR